jgi:hypothetical protein
MSSEEQNVRVECEAMLHKRFGMVSQATIERRAPIGI